MNILDRILSNIISILALLGAIFIGIKQLNIAKSQKELSEWMFKVSAAREEFLTISDVILAMQTSTNQCLLELQLDISMDRKKYLQEQIKYNTKEIEKAEILADQFKTHYSNILSQKIF